MNMLKLALCTGAESVSCAANDDSRCTDIRHTSRTSLLLIKSVGRGRGGYVGDGRNGLTTLDWSWSVISVESIAALGVWSTGGCGDVPLHDDDGDDETYSKVCVSDMFPDSNVCV